MGIKHYVGVSMCSGEDRYTFLLAINLGVKSLDYRVHRYSVLVDVANEFTFLPVSESLIVAHSHKYYCLSLYF